MSTALTKYKYAVQIVQTHVEMEQLADPRHNPIVRRLVDRLWYQLDEHEKEKAPPIPFRSVSHEQSN